MRSTYILILSVIMTVVLAAPESAQAQRVKGNIGNMAHVGSFDYFIYLGAGYEHEIADLFSVQADFNYNIGFARPNIPLIEIGGKYHPNAAFDGYYGGILWGLGFPSHAIFYLFSLQGGTNIYVADDWPIDINAQLGYSVWSFDAGPFGRFGSGGLHLQLGASLAFDLDNL